MVTDPIEVSQLMVEAQRQLEHEGQKEESEVSGSQDDLVTNSESEHVTPVPEVTLDEVQVDKHDATIKNAIRIRNNLVDVTFSPLLSAEVRALQKVLVKSIVTEVPPLFSIKLSGCGWDGKR